VPLPIVPAVIVLGRLRKLALPGVHTKDVQALQHSHYPANMASASSIATPVPFPQPAGIRDPHANATPPDSPSNTRRQRTSTNASTASNRIRTASIKLMEANPPPGMWAATGATASKAPSLADIRRGSFGSDGWNEETQRQRAGSRTSQEDRMRPSRRTSAAVSPLEGGTEPFPAVTEEDTRDHQPVSPARNRAQYKEAGTAVELKQTNTNTDMTDNSETQQPLTNTSEVRIYCCNDYYGNGH
jgi:hypothetical protein